jgi:hypothetical protein
MKSNRIDREAPAGMDRMSETRSHDPDWGDSTEGPVRREGEIAPPSATGVTERLLPRDSRRDPWGGPPVQNVDELPSGFYDDRHPADGYTDVPDDEATGGLAGIVGRDDRLIDRGK